MSETVNHPPGLIDCPCPHAAAVADKVRMRAQHGFKKYGQTLARTDLTHLQWLIHHQEELLDAAGYVQRMIDDEMNKMGMGNALVTNSVDSRMVRCLKCGTEFNLRTPHTCP